MDAIRPDAGAFIESSQLLAVEDKTAKKLSIASKETVHSCSERAEYRLFFAVYHAPDFNQTLPAPRFYRPIKTVALRLLLVSIHMS